MSDPNEDNKDLEEAGSQILKWGLALMFGLLGIALLLITITGTREPSVIFSGMIGCGMCVGFAIFLVVK